LTDEDFTYEKQYEYMMDLVKTLSKEGRSVKEILDEPFHFLVELVAEDYKTVKKETSLIAAFSPLA
jgi:hypothetical protein